MSTSATRQYWREHPDEAPTNRLLDELEAAEQTVKAIREYAVSPDHIEAAARAMWERHVVNAGMPWDELDGPLRKIYLEDAEAAIRASLGLGE